MFQLIKWYCDVVTEDGCGAILYSARLNWGPVRAAYAAVRSFAHEMPPQERATGRRVEPPRLEGDVLAWHSKRLRTHGRWCRDAPPLERRLVAARAGTLDWCCLMPRARASVQIGDTRLEGLGYVERLQLGIRPWKLGMTTLRWGRYLSLEHWLVWIAWEGGEGGEGATARRWVWLDGLEQPGAAPDDAGVAGLSENRRLIFGGDGSSDLGERPVLATIRGPLPALARRIAGRLGSMREHKRLARSTIVQEDRVLDQGWTLYEEVAW